MQVQYQVEECREDPTYSYLQCPQEVQVISGMDGPPGEGEAVPVAALYSSPLSPSGFPYDIPTYQAGTPMVVTFGTTMHAGGWSMIGSSSISLNIATSGNYEITTVCQVESTILNSISYLQLFATFNTAVVRESISTCSVAMPTGTNSKTVRQIYSSFMVNFPVPGTLMFHLAKAPIENSPPTNILSSAEQAVGTEPYWYTVTVAKVSN